MNRELLERSTYEVHLMAYPGYKLNPLYLCFRFRKSVPKFNQSDQSAF